METQKHINIVKKICDGVTTSIELKDYIMFEDRWVGKDDKILYDENGNSFLVLDFQVIEENTLAFPEVMPYLSGWMMQRFSCVKLDKKVNVGDFLYTSYEND